MTDSPRLELVTYIVYMTRQYIQELGYWLRLTRMTSSSRMNDFSEAICVHRFKDTEVIFSNCFACQLTVIPSAIAELKAVT